jgi:nucleoside diphosphate kinase
MINSRVRRSSLADLNNSSRAFVMFKPDAVKGRKIANAICRLSESLDKSGIKHRIIAPVLAKMSVELVDTLYKEHVNEEWFKQSMRPFMVGAYPDINVPSCPVVAFMLEMRGLPPRDIYKILRSDEIIGPTNPLEDIAEYPEKAERIKKSVRYELASGNPFQHFDKIRFPLMNGIHCSANGPEAEKELAAFYLSIYELILPYYSREASDFLRERLQATKTKYDLPANDFRIPLFSDTSGNCPDDPKDITINKRRNSDSISLFNKEDYKDFKADAASRLFEQFKEISPTLIKLDKSFFT